MLYVKDGYPDVNENVLCIVTKIYGNTVFVSLPEYEKEGVLTISEIAPGRIRNLRDHVVEDKHIICKVLRVDESQNRIDVSLRRVNLQATKQKNEEIKKEEFSEKMYEDIAQKIGTDKEDLFERTYEVIFEEHESVFDMLYEVMIDNKKIELFNKLSKQEREEFITAINERIKPEEETLKKKFKLSSTAENGVILVKNALSESVDSVKYDKLKVVYLGAGDYEIVITHDDMKSADKVFRGFKSELEKQSKTNGLKVEI